MFLEWNVSRSKMRCPLSDPETRREVLNNWLVLGASAVVGSTHHLVRKCVRRTISKRLYFLTKYFFSASAQSKEAKSLTRMPGPHSLVATSTR